MSEPVACLQLYQAIKEVRAGAITEVVRFGCYVQEADADFSHLRLFEAHMTARYTPVVGDYWVVYGDGYQSISPRAAFEDGYVAIE